MKASSYAVRLSLAQRRAILDIFPQMADRLQPDTNGQRAITFSIPELQAILWCVGEEIPIAASGSLRNSLRRIVTIFQQAIRDAHGIGAIPTSQRLYQFRITLEEIAPAIWRRIQVKDCTLDQLHYHIQLAMGWTNSHLHRFEIDGIFHGDPELVCESSDCFAGVNSRYTRISDIVPKSGARIKFSYTYDYGDCWTHEILFEGCLAKEKGDIYPLCLEGERACPPEDAGGVSGYQNLLEVLANPNHEEYWESREWVGEKFDPEHFDSILITQRMQRGIPEWRELKAQQ